ncbi:hypothetical protein SEVIR_1G083800v4 [Setaria viridis]|uniref:Uncharacterized protein n=1 Tax=Setaria viridis TaxID=4556 RepID=A0A4U6W7W1_SETVI|nr:hypothetical protein SEVIR_1G083800v2 [Setaria viridis]
MPHICSTVRRPSARGAAPAPSASCFGCRAGRSCHKRTLQSGTRRLLLRPLDLQPRRRPRALASAEALGFPAQRRWWWLRNVAPPSRKLRAQAVRRNAAFGPMPCAETVAVERPASRTM